ncbi:MAG: DUF1786 family protein [Thermodesulfobacteriota bacterium]
MSRYLLIDIGAGTMDILYYDDTTALSYKAVVRSPVQYVAEKAAGLAGNLLLTGNEMGGGAISAVLKKRAQTHKVVMTASAAATVHHDLKKVTGSGIQIIEDAEAQALLKNRSYSVLEIGDLDLKRLRQIVEGFGVPFRFDKVGICAQDHGIPPEGMSHLDYRHGLFKAILDKTPFPHALLYPRDNVPETFNRLRSIAGASRHLPADEVYLMDSGMAAILGASLDIRAVSLNKVLVLDIATSHTVGAALDAGELAGFFEYHTHDITLTRIERLIADLADGKLRHEQILAEGGHGAYTRKSFGYDAVEIIVATGPRRKLVENSRLPIVFGAPYGDNMMTGTVGLLEAIRRHHNLDTLCYL